MSKERAQPDDIADKQTDCDNQQGHQERRGGLDNWHRMVNEYGNNIQIVGNQEVVDKVDVKCASAYVLQ